MEKWYIGIQGLGMAQLGSKSRPSQKGTQFVATSATQKMKRHRNDKKCVNSVPKNRKERIQANKTLTSEQKRTKRRRHKKHRKNYRNVRRNLGITTDSAPQTKKDNSGRLYKKWCRKTRRRFFTHMTTASTLRRFKARCRQRPETTTNQTS